MPKGNCERECCGIGLPRSQQLHAPLLAYLPPATHSQMHRPGPATCRDVFGSARLPNTHLLIIFTWYFCYLSYDFFFSCPLKETANANPVVRIVENNKNLKKSEGKQNWEATKYLPDRKEKSKTTNSGLQKQNPLNLAILATHPFVYEPSEARFTLQTPWGSLISLAKLPNFPKSH